MIVRVARMHGTLWCIHARYRTSTVSQRCASSSITVTQTSVCKRCVRHSTGISAEQRRMM